MTEPLHRLRVVELCGDRPGAVAGMLLADLGAAVTRVEGPDGVGRRPPPQQFADPVCWDRAKALVVAAAADPLDDPVVGPRLAGADVVLVDGGPDAVSARGLEPDRLASRLPRAVVTWLPPHGARGRHGSLPADALLLSAVSGYANHQPALTDVPIAPVVPVAECIQGGMAVAASLAALLERRRSGHGQVVTVSGLHAVAALEASVMNVCIDVDDVYRTGRDSRASPHFRAYRCGDGAWLFLATLIPTLFLKALEVLDAFEVMLIDGVDGEFLNLLEPARGRQAMQMLQARFETRPRDAWLAALQDVGVPTAPVWDRAEWLASEPFAAVGGRRTFVRPDVGPVSTPVCPLRLDVIPGASSPAGDDRWPDRPASLTSAAGGPLAGLRVLDLSTFLAGPFGPAMLADWGADVIKVETPAGDPYRTFTLAYLAVNHAKRSVVADLHTEAGQELLAALIASADVLVDNVRPSARARVGVDFERVERLNPSIVHVNTTAFGIGGTYAERPGFDPVIQALSGMMVAAGAPGQPLNTSTPVHDVSAATLVTVGVLAGLWERAEHGHGLRGITSLAASSSLLQCGELTEFDGRPPTATGGIDYVGDATTHRYYPAADGWVAIAARDADQAAASVTALGLDAAAEPGADALGAAIASRSVKEVVASLSAAGVPAAPVLPRDDWGEDEHLAANDFAQIVTDPVFGRCRIVRTFATFSRSGTASPSGALAVQGAHTDEVVARVSAGTDPWGGGRPQPPG